MTTSVEYYDESKEFEFVEEFVNIVEGCPIVAQELAKWRPFGTKLKFLAAVEKCIENLSTEQKIKILEGIPDLAGRLLDQNLLSPESTEEQKAAGLHILSADTKALLNTYNTRYREKFGFPFVICARKNKIKSILKSLQIRFDNTKEKEIATAIEEVTKIAELRVLNVLDKYSVESKEDFLYNKLDLDEKDAQRGR